MRGILTKEVQEISKDYLGREITTKELRLYPFIDYCIKNSGYMDRKKVDNEELDILKSYGENKIKRDDGGYVYVSKDFYDFMQKVLFEAYVETKMEGKNEM